MVRDAWYNNIHRPKILVVKSINSAQPLKILRSAQY